MFLSLAGVGATALVAEHPPHTSRRAETKKAVSHLPRERLRATIPPSLSPGRCPEPVEGPFRSRCWDYQRHDSVIPFSLAGTVYQISSRLATPRKPPVRLTRVALLWGSTMQMTTIKTQPINPAVLPLSNLSIGIAAGNVEHHRYVTK